MNLVSMITGCYYNPLKRDTSMSQTHYIPRPLFDSLDKVQALYKECQQVDPRKTILHWLRNCLFNVDIRLPTYATVNFQQVLNFLYTYRGSQDTFNAYRRELERLLQWSWFVQKKSIVDLKRLDIESFIEFCQDPYKRWIGLKIVSRFVDHEAQRISNPAWRPFIAKISKKAHQDGQRAEKVDFAMSQEGIKVLFAVLSSFYHFLIQEKITEINPLLQIRQKSKFIRKTTSSRPIRRLSETQWKMVIQTAQKMAEKDPERHERTLFIMNILYGMYLRISELAATKRWTPKMCDFFRDAHENWWFKTVGKGNKERQIAVSNVMLKALKRWRKHLGLVLLPTPDDRSPLLPKQKGKGAITSTRPISVIVQNCFNQSVEQLKKEKYFDEAEMLRSATVHWLRHTGISDDVKRRPREHVRDDAGHSSGAITDRYIDVELLARAKSAKNKPLITEDESDVI
jgi:site-specific recombinase XerD